MTGSVPIDPHLLVLFGATGDLSRRKLLPALFRLLRSRGFEDRTHVLGVGNSRRSDEDFRQMAVEAFTEAGFDREEIEEWCLDCLSYQSLSEGFDGLADRIAGLESAHGLPGNRAFYLAIPPEAIEGTLEGLAGSGLDSASGWIRLVIEKPFGVDLESAEELNRSLHARFSEDQIFRIDHYLAKETVQNLLVFRFANPIFESSWNRDRIESVQITVAETIGIEGRAGYFDKAGMVRDIVQNHMLQLLALVAMEPPVRLDPDSIRDEKVKALRSIYPIGPEAVVRGQYTAGDIDGHDVAGYLEEVGVGPDSATETFVALRVAIDNWRWRGVPFVLRAGKRLPDRLTQIAVTFKQPPVSLFDADGEGQVNGNELYITLQPDEGFDLMFDVKSPGGVSDVRSRSLRFRYADAFGSLPDAYDTLLEDLLIGDQTLFVRGDETEEAWRIIQLILDGDEVHEYPAGSWGPQEASSLLDRWRVRID